jgi:sporulation protein YlmC with PRC-barrel domain
VTGRVRDLALHLLDRQVLDTAGRFVAKVDDVELVEREGQLYVAALLTGPQALGPRLGGLLGRWLVWLSAGLGRGDTSLPGRIGLELVTDIGPQITVARSRRELGVHVNEDRARAYLVSRIPGAGRDAGE